jgi:hypothetical protein
VAERPPRVVCLRGAPWDALRELALPAGDWALFGSAVLLARGLVEEVRDLDVVVRGAAWQRVLTFGRPERAERGDLVVRLGALELFDGFAPFDAAAMIDRAETIDGLPFVTLADTVAWKRALGRPKDLEHVRLIEVALRGTASGSAPIRPTGRARSD